MNMRLLLQLDAAVKKQSTRLAYVSQVSMVTALETAWVFPENSPQGELLSRMNPLWDLMSKHPQQQAVTAS